MENNVSTTIKGMNNYQRKNPRSIALTVKQRKVLLDNDVDLAGFVGNRKEKAKFINEKLQIFMKPALTNAQRQKNFRDKFKAENDGNDYYKVRNEYKLIKGNANKKFTKEKAKEIVKKKLRFVLIRKPTVRITKSKNRYDTYIYDISNPANASISEIVMNFLKLNPLKKNQKIRLIGMKTGYESIYSSTNVFFNEIDYALSDFIKKIGRYASEYSTRRPNTSNGYRNINF